MYLKSDPKNAKVYKMLAECYEKVEDKKEALKHFRRYKIVTMVAGVYMIYKKKKYMYILHM